MASKKITNQDAYFSREKKTEKVKTSEAHLEKTAEMFAELFKTVAPVANTGYIPLNKEDTEVKEALRVLREAGMFDYIKYRQQKKLTEERSDQKDAELKKGDYEWVVRKRRYVINKETATKTPPSEIVCITPLNKEKNVNYKTYLEWKRPEKGTDPITYRVYLSDDVNRANTKDPLCLVSSQESLTYGCSLEKSHIYYWKIVAVNEYGESESVTMQFETGSKISGAIPSSPKNISPANNSHDNALNILLRWQEPEEGTRPFVYNLYLSKDKESVENGKEKAASYMDGLTRLVSLDKNATYYWKIEAVNDVGKKEGAVWKFKTGNGATSGENTPPTAPELVSPSDGEEEARTDQKLVWKQAKGSQPIYYDVYFGKKENPGLYKNGTTSTVLSPGILDYDTTYFWKVVSRNHAGIESSETRWFRTISKPTGEPVGLEIPPSAPEYIYPLNGMKDVPTTLSCSWYDSKEGSLPIGHSLFIGKTEDAFEQMSDNRNETSLYIRGLSNYTTYYWYVKSKNEFGETIGPVWSFVTGEASNEVPFDNLEEEEEDTYYYFPEGQETELSDYLTYADIVYASDIIKFTLPTEIQLLEGYAPSVKVGEIFTVEKAGPYIGYAGSGLDEEGNYVGKTLNEYLDATITESRQKLNDNVLKNMTGNLSDLISPDAKAIAEEIKDKLSQKEAENAANIAVIKGDNKPNAMKTAETADSMRNKSPDMTTRAVYEILMADGDKQDLLSELKPLIDMMADNDAEHADIAETLYPLFASVVSLIDDTMFDEKQLTMDYIHETLEDLQTRIQGPAYITEISQETPEEGETGDSKETDLQDDAREQAGEFGGQQVQLNGKNIQGVSGTVNDYVFPEHFQGASINLKVKCNGSTSPHFLYFGETEDPEFHSRFNADVTINVPQDNDKTYYFKVRSFKGEDQYIDSKVYSFYFHKKPSKPKAVLPENNTVVNIKSTRWDNDNDIALKWANIDYEYATGALLKLGDSAATMETIYTSSEKIGDAYNVTLTPNKIYYWQVVTTSEHGNTEGDIWKFELRS